MSGPARVAQVSTVFNAARKRHGRAGRRSHQGEDDFAAIPAAIVTLRQLPR